MCLSVSVQLKQQLFVLVYIFCQFLEIKFYFLHFLYHFVFQVFSLSSFYFFVNLTKKRNFFTRWIKMTQLKLLLHQNKVCYNCLIVKTLTKTYLYLELTLKTKKQLQTPKITPYTRPTKLTVKDYFNEYKFLEDLGNKKIKCIVCNQTFSGKKIRRHFATQKHTKNIQSTATGYSVDLISTMNRFPGQFRVLEEQPKTVLCTICGHPLSATLHIAERHNNSDRHKTGLLTQEAHKKYMEDASVDKISRDLCRVLKECRIPLEVCKNESLRKFIANLSGYVPHSLSVIRDKHAPEIEVDPETASAVDSIDLDNFNDPLEDFINQLK